MADKVATRIKASSIGVNTQHVADVASPFSGFKQSGWAREIGYDAMRQASVIERKCVSHGSGANCRIEYEFAAEARLSSCIHPPSNSAGCGVGRIGTVHEILMDWQQ